MHDILINYLNSYTTTPLSGDEIDLIQSFFTPKKFKRRQYFLREGDVCKRIGFIVKGSARMYTVDEKGHEHIIHFGLESWWLGDPESYINLTPSLYYIELLEDSELLVITAPNAHVLRNKSRCFDLAVIANDKFATIAMQKRIHAAICMTAEERYCELSHTNPEFLERFSMNMIASYLGLSPETLSRIRKSTIHKKFTVR
jgi:CRP-like cAMP-binding protein